MVNYSVDKQYRPYGTCPNCNAGHTYLAKGEGGHLYWLCTSCAIRIVEYLTLSDEQRSDYLNTYKELACLFE